MADKIIFYSSVKDKSLFQTQKFYQIDIDILQRMGYEITLSNNIWDAFKFWSYDIVFAYFYRYSFFFALIAKIFRKKIYMTGGIDSLDKEYVGDKAYKVQNFFFKLCYTVADRCIIVSQADLMHVEEIVGKNARKLAYSEHTIETNAFYNSFEERSLDFCTIGWMGNEGNVQRKGMDKAICLFSMLKEKPEFFNSRLFIMGKKGEGTILLESLIKSLRLEDSIIIMGEVSEQQKIDTLRQCMYYIQLSKYEGFGIAALEALVAGNIIIHSGKGGLGNPIYKDHIIVNIDEELEKQFQSIYSRIKNIDIVCIKQKTHDCLSFYDNARRLEDFKEILGNAVDF